MRQQPTEEMNEQPKDLMTLEEVVSACSQLQNNSGPSLGRIFRSALKHLEAGREILEAGLWALAQANAYGPLNDPQWLEDYCKASDILLPTIPGNSP